MNLDVRDLHVYAGLAILCAGIWMIYMPAALVSAGLILIWLGIRRID